MAGIFGFFDYTKPGPGVDKEAPQKHGFFVFWEILGRKFWKLTGLNLLYAVCSIPAFIIYFLLVSSVMPFFQEFATNAGYELSDLYTSIIFLTAILANLLLIIFGAGPVSAGFSYVLRNYSRQEHAWILSDFFDHFKKNFLQGLIAFLIDIVAMVVIVGNIYFYSGDTPLSPTLKTIMITIFSVICIFYTMMHFYIYPMMVTFDLKLKHIYRNAFLMTMIKLPQNIVILFTTVSITAIISYLSISLNVMILAIISAVILYSFLGFMQVSYSYPVMAKLLIAKDENTLSEPDEDTISEDI